MGSLPDFCLWQSKPDKALCNLNPSIRDSAVGQNHRSEPAFLFLYRKGAIAPVDYLSTFATAPLSLFPYCFSGIADQKHFSGWRVSVLPTGRAHTLRPRLPNIRPACAGSPTWRRWRDPGNSRFHLIPASRCTCSLPRRSNTRTH